VLIKDRVGERLASELGSGSHDAWFRRCLTWAAEFKLQRLDTLHRVTLGWQRRLGERHRSFHTSDAVARLLR